MNGEPVVSPKKCRDLCPFFRFSLPIIDRLTLYFLCRLWTVQRAFEFLDLVAEQGGFLEFQIIRGGNHFAFEFVDGFGDINVHLRVAQNGIGLLAFGFVTGEAFLDGAAHAARCDAMFLVVGDLLLTAVFGDGEEFLDAIGHHVGVKNHFAVKMARGAACGLDQARFAAQRKSRWTPAAS